MSYVAFAKTFLSANAQRQFNPFNRREFTIGAIVLAEVMQSFFNRIRYFQGKLMG